MSLDMQHRILEAEQSVLGSVLIDSNAMDSIFDMLEPRDFTSQSHEMIWKVMQYLYRNHSPIDTVTVTTTLVKHKKIDDIGGINYLQKLAGSVPSTQNIIYYAKAIQSQSYKRRGVKIGERIIEITNELDFEKDEDYFQEVERLAQSLRPDTNSDMKHLSETKQEYIDYLNQTDNFVYTGFRDFDEWMGGIGRGWLYILAGRPSVGKTAKALQTAANIASQNVGPVLFWSQEMRRNQLISRMLSPITGVNANRIRKKTLDDLEKKKLIKAYEELEKLPLHIMDAKNVTIDEVRATVRKITRSHGTPAAVFVDYLTIMKIPQQKGETRSQAVGYVTRSAKQMAVEFDFPFFMLAQLSRDGAGEPKLEHLRDSGEIEQDADVVEFLWHDPDDTSNHGKVIQSTIAKGRDIGVNHFRYLFKGWIQKYEEFGPYPVSSFGIGVYMIDEDDFEA